MKTIINFTHPLNKQQLNYIENLLGEAIFEVRIPVHFNQDESFLEQLRALLGTEIVTCLISRPEDFLIIPPAHSVIACLLMAELHGLIGHFPALIRIKPTQTPNSIIYEVDEIINLQTVRDQSRLQRNYAEKKY